MRNLIKIVFLALILGTVAARLFAQTDNLVGVYDGRTDLKRARISPADEKLLAAEVKDKTALLKEKNQVVCDEEEFSVIDAAAGAFTKPGVSQKAFMYELCRSGQSFGIGGIIIVENGRIVAHYTYGENGLYEGLTSLPDINQNGLQEILLVAGGTGQGYTITAVEIWELAPAKNLNFMGSAEVYNDNYGTESKVYGATANKFSVQSGTAPVFFRETYLQKSEKAKWILRGQPRKIVLKKAEPPKIYKVL